MAAVPSPTCVREDRAIFRALRIVERRAAEHGEAMTDPRVAGQLFRLRLGNELREHFEVAFLDNRHRLLAVERLFSGTIDGATVHVRVVVQRALALNAVAMIVAHNHPSGDATPSTADKAITRELEQVLAMMGMRLLDHMIVTAHDAVSMTALGMTWASGVAGLPTALPSPSPSRTRRRKAG
ncbi:MAG: JAB domain-containing protein [Rhodanobacter sp.]|nr:JAB domain-containing protein [Rhodanobacter sp.]